MHNHKVKDLLRYQKGFDVSYNFVEIGLQYFKSLLPYFYFTEAHDNIIGCQKTIMQFVDGENFKNIDVLLKNRYFEVINAILHLRPILNNDSPENLRKEKKLINPSLYSLFEDTARITNDGYIEMKGLRIPLKVIKDNSDCLSCIIDSEILDQVFSKILNAEILKDDAEVVLGEDYVKTKQTKENPRFLKQNAVISILKTKAVSIVLDMLSRDHDYTDKIIYRLRTDVNSEVFRLNFMYQTIMLQTQYGGNYYLSYFNKVYLPSINNITRSSMVIELGHMLYSLVIRMHSLSSEGSVDLGYKRKIFDCLPKEVRNDFEIQRDFFSQIMYFLVSLKCNF